MPDRRAAFNQSAKRALVEKLEIIVLAVCRIQQLPALDIAMRAAIVEAELGRLAATDSSNGHDLDQDMFDRVTLAIRDWHEH